MKGMLLSDNGDLKMVPVFEKGKIQSGLTLGDSMVQDACIVLGLNQGEVKVNPLLGPNLIRYVRAKASKVAITKQVKIHLQRAGIDYDELKDKININLKTT